MDALCRTTHRSLYPVAMLFKSHLMIIMMPSIQKIGGLAGLNLNVSFEKVRVQVFPKSAKKIEDNTVAMSSLEMAGHMHAFA